MRMYEKCYHSCCYKYIIILLSIKIILNKVSVDVYCIDIMSIILCVEKWQEFAKLKSRFIWNRSK